jgi:hypothetical protein
MRKKQAENSTRSAPREEQRSQHSQPDLAADEDQMLRLQRQLQAAEEARERAELRNVELQATLERYQRKSISGHGCDAATPTCDWARTIRRELRIGPDESVLDAIRALRMQSTRD